ncbi:hypothetical protein RJ639_042905 [Escallonia herrerae]|uniref:Ubiquitin-like domain-containing protein n=1 Tax=Escallonia herrerae TaxID=1293975 RepID=A0AA88WBY7_9ASTE|nr:hypothetical protein RJ639_042905 [Escallonia herrerae]
MAGVVVSFDAFVSVNGIEFYEIAYHVVENKLSEVYLCTYSRMGSNGAHEIAHVNEAEGSETTIEIKLKTLDSQTYTLRVNKQMPVPELKEQIASVTGVLSEEQRLICRGRVLKDDQLLSAYRILSHHSDIYLDVEDGHTLHMVVGRPTPPSSGSLPSHSDPASDTSHGQRIQVAPGVVVETFDFPHLGDGIPPDISRIVSAVIGAFGVNSTVSGTEGTDIQF